MSEFVPITPPGMAGFQPVTTTYAPPSQVLPSSAPPSADYNYRSVEGSPLDYYDYSDEEYAEYAVPLETQYHNHEINTKQYHRRKHPKFRVPLDYYDAPLDNRIRGIRKNDAIFRQGGADLNWMASMAANAIKIFSLITNLGGGGSADPPATSSSPDRIDTNTLAAGAAAADDIDIAIATLASFGGKYLREMAMWAWEHATATPAESIGDSIPSPAEVTNSIAEKVGTVASVSSNIVTTKAPAKSDKSPLQSLSPEELEKLGLAAVNAGAEPTKLQQAFASAQISGDWSLLENEIVGALGEDALPGGKPSKPSNPIAALSNFISQPTSATSSVSSTSSTSSTSSSGSGGIMSSIASTLKQATTLVGNIMGGSGPQGIDKIGEAADVTTGTAEPEGLVGSVQYFMTKMDRVVNGGVAPAASVKPGTLVASGPLQDSMITRFINEFELQQEALALQTSVNQLITTVNDFMGDNEEAPLESDPNTVSVNKIGVAAEGETAAPSEAGILASLTSIPASIAAAVVNGLKFMSPASATAQNKIGAAEQETFSEVNNFNPVNTLTIAGLGTAAVGSVLWTMYVSSVENRRRQGRSSQDPVPMELTQKFLNGLTAMVDEMEQCQLKHLTCSGKYEMEKWPMANLQAQKRSQMCTQRRKTCLKLVSEERQREEELRKSGKSVLHNLTQDRTQEAIQDPPIERPIDPQPRTEPDVDFLHFPPIDLLGRLSESVGLLRDFALVDLHGLLRLGVEEAASAQVVFLPEVDAGCPVGSQEPGLGVATEHEHGFHHPEEEDDLMVKEQTETVLLAHGSLGIELQTPESLGTYAKLQFGLDESMHLDEVCDVDGICQPLGDGLQSGRVGGDAGSVELGRAPSGHPIEPHPELVENPLGCVGIPRQQGFGHVEATKRHHFLLLLGQGPDLDHDLTRGDHKEVVGMLEIRAIREADLATRALDTSSTAGHELEASASRNTISLSRPLTASPLSAGFKRFGLESTPDSLTSPYLEELLVTLEDPHILVIHQAQVGIEDDQLLGDFGAETQPAFGHHPNDGRRKSTLLIDHNLCSSLADHLVLQDFPGHHPGLLVDVVLISIQELVGKGHRQLILKSWKATFILSVAQQSEDVMSVLMTEARMSLTSAGSENWFEDSPTPPMLTVGVRIENLALSSSMVSGSTREFLSDAEFRYFPTNSLTRGSKSRSKRASLSSLDRIGQEEGHIVGRGRVLHHVVEASLAGVRGLVQALGKVPVEEISHPDYGFRSAVLARALITRLITCVLARTAGVILGVTGSDLTLALPLPISPGLRRFVAFRGLGVEDSAKLTLSLGALSVEGKGYFLSVCCDGSIRGRVPEDEVHDQLRFRWANMDESRPAAPKNTVEEHLVLLLKLLRSKLEDPNVAEPRGHFVNGEDVFPAGQELVPHRRGEISDGKVASDGVFQKLGEPLNEGCDVHQLDKDGQRKSEKDITHQAPSFGPSLNSGNE
eukprot:maker-scaffold493_size155937-snap-gene-0.17 protein:Tk11849 transcript:maker-scaffold493_size155937-snap-gene-0.17-mRNA-1 annotation:"---NA---"